MILRICYQSLHICSSRVYIQAWRSTTAESADGKTGDTAQMPIWKAGAFVYTCDTTTYIMSAIERAHSTNKDDAWVHIPYIGKRHDQNHQGFWLPCQQ